MTVSAVLGQLAAGGSFEEVLADYPYLERADILAALEFAAAAVQERELPLAPASGGYCDLGVRIEHRSVSSGELTVWQPGGVSGPGGLALRGIAAPVRIAGLT